MEHIPKSIQTMIEKLNKNGYEAFLVGGCVRDFVLNRVPKDYDVATSATPEQVKEVFVGVPVIETGISHGTVTVLWGEFPIEITTYRVESTYEDHRRPSEVFFTTQLKEDLARRDFTMNALAYHPKLGMIDYFNGIEDIHNKRICCVGNATERFSEDALRIMRALRFASELDFVIEEKTKKALLLKKELLQYISAERIRVELEKLLCGKAVKDILLDYSEILITIIPESEKMIGFKQHNPHHLYDVYTHTVMAVEAIEPEISLRLTMLFHDIGKPETFRLDEKGIGHFYGHPQVSAKLTKQIMKKLRFDKKTIHKVEQLVLYHDYEIMPRKKSIRKAVFLVKDYFEDLLKVKRADYLAQANPEEKLENLEKVKSIWEEMKLEEECLSLKDLVITGRDLEEVKPVYRGRILSRLLEEVMEEKLVNEKEELLARVNELLEEFLLEETISNK